MARSKRRITLIQPRFQLKLTLSFLGVCVLALTLQFLLFTSALTRLALELPHDGPLLLESVPKYSLVILGISFLVLMPMTLFAGILFTFRIAGPLYRFEMFLRAIIRGERPQSCRIRKGDELQEFCVLLNQATAPLREADASAPVTPQASMDQAA